ncbi:MAG: hypothetical protein QCI38_06105, partial [Candidatus Thermoplasmatota archaeon]|nr:hypothetical protein [Candidatus Thermoplasmatota archaeon]
LLIVAMLLTVFSAGCLGGGEEETKDGPKEPNLVAVQGSIPEVAGWAQVEGESKASVAIPISITGDKVTRVVFTINAQDSDAANSETDEGSEPDKITVTIMWGNVSEKHGPMNTPASFNIELKAPAGEYLPNSGTVTIDGVLGSGKPVYFFGRIVYVDQGFAYQLNTEYTVMQEE